MNTNAREWPANPFWDFSLKVYAAPDVAPGLLELQDAHGLDVNLLLFCTWAGHSGPGRLTGSALDRSCLVVGDWQQQLVRPLRALRREVARLPTVPAGLSRTMKAVLLDAELTAERIEQQLLAGQPGTGAAHARHGLEVAAANLLDYLARAGLGIDDGVREALSPMLAAAFPAESAGRIAKALSLH
ncbi:MAG: TIGR02444 family protein [Chromatiales bacterium]|nr:TIGR02444 family protein [Chromatiales bacterium]